MENKSALELFNEGKNWIVGVQVWVNDDETRLDFYNLRDMHLTADTTQRLHYIECFENDERGKVIKSPEGDGKPEPDVLSKIVNVFTNAYNFRWILDKIRLDNLDQFESNTIFNHVRSNFTDEEIERAMRLIFTEENNGIQRFETILRAIREDSDERAKAVDRLFVDWRVSKSFEEVPVKQLRNIFVRLITLLKETATTEGEFIKAGLIVLSARNELTDDLNTLDMDRISKIGRNTSKIYNPMMSTNCNIRYDHSACGWIDENGIEYDHDENFRPIAKPEQEDDFEFLFGRYIDKKGVELDG